jgi:hypothetical protein
MILLLLLLLHHHRHIHYDILSKKKNSYRHYQPSRIGLQILSHDFGLQQLSVDSSLL